MNFECDKCQQKYHVADDKVRGRAVTRFRCKKCSHVIELHGDGGPGASGAPGVTQEITSAVPLPASTPAPAAPVAPTATKPAAPTPGVASAPRPAGTLGSGLGARAAPRPRAATTTGPAFGSPGFAKQAPRPVGAAPAAPAARSAASATSQAGAARAPSTSAILDASETGWYAGIRDLPVGPLSRRELMERVQHGDVTADTLVWREGLDDWRPLSSVSELGDLLRAAAQRMSGNLLTEMGKRQPATPAPPPAPERPRGGQVVPIGAARPAPRQEPPPPAPPPESLDDEEATQITGMDSALASMMSQVARGEALPEAPAARPHEEPRAPHRAPAHAPAPPQARAAPAPSPPPAHVAPVAVAAPPVASPVPAPAFAMPPPPAAAVAAPPPPARGADAMFDAAPRPDPGAIARPNEPTLSVTEGSAGATSGALGPSWGVAGTGESVRVPKRHVGGLPTAAWVMMGGVLVAGIAGGIAIGKMNTASAPAPVASTPVTTPAPTPSGPGTNTVAPPVQIPPEPAAPTTPTASPETPTASPETHPTRHPARANGHGQQPRQPTAANADALLRQAAALGGGAGPGGSPVVARPTTPTTTSAAPESPGLTGGARVQQVLRAFEQSRVAHQCWQASLRNNPALQPVTVQVDVTVSGAGRVTDISVANSPDPGFERCLRSRATAIRPLGGGEALTARTSVSLTVGG